MQAEPSVHRYVIGWICALSIEYVAARQALDAEHNGSEFVSQPGDSNSYTFGSIAGHNVVIAVMPSGKYGLTTAAIVARDMFRSFPNLRLGLMVGIGGGAPTPMHDIRLGDVVISAPSSGRGGVYQYDFGKAMQGRGFQPSGSLREPPTFLLTAVARLAARLEEDNVDLNADVNNLLSRRPNLRQNYARPDPASDVLYIETYVHPDLSTDCAETCRIHKNVQVPRSPRRSGHLKPVVHHGLIASANQVMKDSTVRNKIANEAGILCFDMESAGLMDQVPSLIIRGICDYADSHKNKTWQGYAAMTAAAYARRLLSSLPPITSEQGLASLNVSGQGPNQRRGSLQRARRRVVVPVAPNSRFTGRRATLETIGKMLTANMGSQARVALIGMGGVGKTEIVRAFIRSPMAIAAFSSVLWVFAQSRTQAIKSFSKLAAALALAQPSASSNPINSAPAGVTGTAEIPEEVSAVLDWMSEEDNQDWLLVIDNLDDLESFDIEDFLPKVSFGHIIFTSRRTSAGRLGQSINISVMSDSEAVQMLHRCSGAKRPAQDDVAMQLTQALGNLPLALDQAAAYIAAQDSSYEHYQDLLRDGQAELLSQELPRAVWSYQQTVYTTWQMSMSQITRQDPLAAELIQIAALFAANDIPLELMCQGVQPAMTQDGCFLNGFFEFIPPSGNYDAILGPLPPHFSRTRQGFAASIGRLISFSLMSRTAMNSFSIHPLVHSWLNHLVDSSGKRDSIIYSAVGLLNRAIIWSCNSGNLKNTQLLYPHIFNINRLLESTPELLEVIDVTRLAGCLIALDAWATLSVDWATLTSADEFFAMLQRVQSKSNWRIAEELWLLRAISRCRARGRQDAAASLCEKLFRSAPDASKYQSMIRGCIALAYAPFLYRRLLYDQARHILQTHCITENDRTNFLLARKNLVLGSIELDDGNFQQAESLLQSCKIGLHRHVGQEYFLLAVWYQRMGFCLLQQGRAQESEALIWSLLEHKISNLNANRQNFAFCDYELFEAYARALRAQKRFAEIEQLNRSILTKTLGHQPLQRSLGELCLQITTLERMYSEFEAKGKQGAEFDTDLWHSTLAEAHMLHERALRAYEQEWKRGFWIFQDFHQTADKF
ncbi:hypothetical protein MY1884_009236, partial [Beauveria asiatica]